MMSDFASALAGFRPANQFFVGIDSDGCVFDTMELKHKECFAPAFIKHFHLQAASKYAREVWEFVNLYSRTRGVNRFPALANALNLLAERPEVQARGVTVPTSDALDDWIAREPRLTDATLRQEINERGNATLAPILKWSEAVNAAIADMVSGVPPFPLVRESLTQLASSADLMVVSQTPTPALEREWAEHELAPLVRLIAGQELGSKSDHLRLTAGGRYAPKHVLMIGDAPGDFKAARANFALFYPIIPGREEASWRRFFDEGADRFLAGRFAGDYETALIEEFNASLPERPPWRG
jgi:phosphoglycolate phosphatase-like HAD superfamily hydrolase